MMASLSQIRLIIFDPGVEPFIVTGGIYAFTALYYTRLPALQVLSIILLIAVTVYWSRTILREPRMTWRDLKLTRRHFGRNFLLAMGLAIFGWFYYRVYVYLTRGVVIKLGYGGSLSAIVTIILVALAEEVFFRGYLQNRLNPRFGLLARVLLAVAAMAFYKNIVHMWEGLPLVLQAELSTSACSQRCLRVRQPGGTIVFAYFLGPVGVRSFDQHPLLGYIVQPTCAMAPWIGWISSPSSARNNL